MDNEQPLYNWSTVQFIAIGKVPWTLPDIVAFAQRVEEIHYEDRRMNDKYVSLEPNKADWKTTVPPGCYCEKCRSRFLSFRFVGVTNTMFAPRCGITSQTFEQCSLSEGHKTICDFTSAYVPESISTTVLIFWNGKRLINKRFTELWHAERWAKFCIPIDRHAKCPNV